MAVSSVRSVLISVVDAKRHRVPEARASRRQGREGERSVEPRKFASRRAANFLPRFPLSDLDGSGMRSAIPIMPLASFVPERRRPFAWVG